MKISFVSNNCARLFLAAAALLVGRSARADNPVVQTSFTADPAPLVHDGVVHLYTSHDEDDGQACLYFGNPNLWYVKLNTDMISYSGGIIQEPTKPANHQEGPWRFKGGSCVFGFNHTLNFALTDRHHERRSVCVDKFEYNPDGSIREVPWWDDVGAPQVGTLDPYRRVEAETICWSEGIKTAATGLGGTCVHPTRAGAHIKVKGVDFGVGAKSFEAAAASAEKGGTIELHLDAPSGPLIGTCPIPGTGGADKWEAPSCPITGAVGVRDLFLVFVGNATPELAVDSWNFERALPSIDKTPPLIF